MKIPTEPVILLERQEAEGEGLLPFCLRRKLAS
jgi:hypothetical protein